MDNETNNKSETPESYSQPEIQTSQLAQDDIERLQALRREAAAQRMKDAVSFGMAPITSAIKSSPTIESLETAVKIVNLTINAGVQNKQKEEYKTAKAQMDRYNVAMQDQYTQSLQQTKILSKNDVVDLSSKQGKQHAHDNMMIYLQKRGIINSNGKLAINDIQHIAQMSDLELQFAEHINGVHLNDTDKAILKYISDESRFETAKNKLKKTRAKSSNQKRAFARRIQKDDPTMRDIQAFAGNLRRAKRAAKITTKITKKALKGGAKVTIGSLKVSHKVFRKMGGARLEDLIEEKYQIKCKMAKAKEKSKQKKIEKKQNIRRKNNQKLHKKVKHKSERIRKRQERAVNFLNKHKRVKRVYKKFNHVNNKYKKFKIQRNTFFKKIGKIPFNALNGIAQFKGLIISAVCSFLLIIIKIAGVCLLLAAILSVVGTLISSVSSWFLSDDPNNNHYDITNAYTKILNIEEDMVTQKVNSLNEKYDEINVIYKTLDKNGKMIETEKLNNVKQILSMGMVVFRNHTNEKDSLSQSDYNDFIEYCELLAKSSITIESKDADVIHCAPDLLEECDNTNKKGECKGHKATTVIVTLHNYIYDTKKPLEDNRKIETLFDKDEQTKTYKSYLSSDVAKDLGNKNYWNDDRRSQAIFSCNMDWQDLYGIDTEEYSMNIYAIESDIKKSMDNILSDNSETKNSEEANHIIDLKDIIQKE